MISLAWCKSSIGVSFFFMLLTEIGVWMPLVSGTIQQGYDSFACCSQLVRERHHHAQRCQIVWHSGMSRYQLTLYRDRPSGSAPSR